MQSTPCGLHGRLLCLVTGTAAHLTLMNDKSPSHSVASESIMRPAWVGLAAGGFLVLLGGTILTDWFLRVPSLLQLLPGHVAMVFNTALCFFMAGLALVIPQRWLRWCTRLQITFGTLVVLIAAAMLLQHLTNTNLGIDLRGFHAWLSDPNPTPGRMAPNTALAFLLAGTAIILLPRANSVLIWRTIEVLALPSFLSGSRAPSVTP